MAPVLFLALACVEVPTFEDTGDGCDLTIDETWPVPGAEGVYHRDPVTFWLSEPDPAAVVIADVAGSQGWSEDQTVLSWWPSEPLAPETTHDLVLSTCRGEAPLSFTTSELGLPLEDGVSLLGRTWALDLTSGRWLLAEDLAAGLSGFFERAVLFQVQDFGGVGLQVLAGTSASDGQHQDPCSPTAESQDLDADEAPWFSFGLDGFTLGHDDGGLVLQEFTLSGTIAPDGTWVGGIAWEAVASAAQLGALIGFEADQICELADAADQPCEACPGGGGAASCVRVAADRMTAEAVDTALAVVDEEACDSR